jgi:starch synthase (maltosyl-transferring)
MLSESAGQCRVVIEGVEPQIDAGRYPIKRVVGESVVVEADVFCDGHDHLSAVVCYRAVDPEDRAFASAGMNGRKANGGSPADAWDWDRWREVPMTSLVNDRWRAEFKVDQVGTVCYTIAAWVDRFATWHHELLKRFAAAQVTPVDMAIGAELVSAAAEAADGDDQNILNEWVRRLRSEEALQHTQQICEDPELLALMQRHARRTFVTVCDRELQITVDRERGRYSTWYEMFPRSAANEPGRHGTLKDVEARLPYVADMGFDVLYLPPIHPVGRSFRKGKNNATESGADDVGSPWGIGAKEGGHKSILPELGTFEDFDSLVNSARQLGIELALDIAFQCAPDHPYVTEHPQWFRSRPDGTIQYAENPPKKYQDIYPFDFETDDWQALWQELKSIFDFWIERGVRIFRVDNPHTKPFAFWEWCIGAIKREHPDVLFLAEAFTRPKVMYRLAKLGFSQSYTYFTWRNTKPELTEYLTELTQRSTPPPAAVGGSVAISGDRENCPPHVGEFFRPNFWPNTPDILAEYLQVGGRGAFMSRLVLAATLSSNYGIYGPPFEHCWGAPRDPGSEEYLDSEKYQVHHHDLKRSDSLSGFIARVNRIRREHPVLQSNDGLQFHPVDNDQLICFSKSSADCSDVVLVVVNLDPHHTQAGFVELPLSELQLDEATPCQVHDLLSDSRFLWHGSRNFVELAPQVAPAHIFQIRRRVRSERDFEYYL